VTVTIRTNVMAALGRIAAPAALASFGGGVGAVLLVLGMWGAAIRRGLGHATVALAAVLALASCGGDHGGHGSSGATTPAGTYPVTITLASGATTHTVGVTVVVN
jgi:hypothetical protein